MPFFNNINRRTGGGLEHAGKIATFGLHQYKPTQTHVIHGTGHGSDVFGDLCLSKHNCDVVKLNFCGHSAGLLGFPP